MEGTRGKHLVLGGKDTIKSDKKLASKPGSASIQCNLSKLHGLSGPHLPGLQKEGDKNTNHTKEL